MTLFRQFFKAHLKGFLIWAAAGALFALTGTRSAGAFIGTDAIEAMPQSLLELFGNLGGLNEVDVYLTIALSKGTVLIPALYAVIAALSIVTREVDKRTVEFLLALPVGRLQVLASRIAVLALDVTGVTAAIWAVYRFDMAAQGYRASWGHLDLAFVNVWLLAIALGVLTLAFSMWVDDYSVGVKLFLGGVTLAYFLEFLLRSAHVSRAWRWASPFSYADPASVMRTGAIAAGDVAVLTAVIIIALAVSFRAFGRKQFAA